MKRKVNIIGSGFASLSAACYLASNGFEVTIFEKNKQLGGRARQFKRDGFLFDIGPTWYWMPDVFEKFFDDFNKKPCDYYQLEKLSPAYKVFFGSNDAITIPSTTDEIYALFEQIESGSSKALRSFLDTARSNYEVAVQDLVYRPGVSPLELITPKTITKLSQLFYDIRKQIAKGFENKKLIKILEFPVLFLGAKPSNTPAMYNFMNWADFGLGTWHPKGGMYKVVDAMVELAHQLGVKIKTEAVVSEIIVNSTGTAEGLMVNGKLESADFLLSGADYHHTECLIPEKHRQYSQRFWDKKILAPSALLFFVGFNKKVDGVNHHTLFFDEEFDKHAEYIYDTPSWPKDPLFYASFPSISDDVFAPDNKEAATFLIPIASGLEDTEEIRKKYFDLIIERLEKLTNQSLRENILFMESYCVNDFVEDYNSYKGNAYGMANTLTQTAFMRPKIKSKKVNNLYFTGQLTVPGPGVPPALISGKIAAESIIKNAAL